MINKLESVPFVDSPEKHAKLDAVIAELKPVTGSLIQVLKKAQEIYGYLPLEVQIMVAQGLDVSLEEVYGVTTFYSFFNLDPKGEHEISCCLGTACYVKGAGEIYDEFQKQLGIKGGGITPDGKISLSACRCIGACGLAPVCMVGSDVYGRLTPADVAGIIAKYR